MQSRMVEEALKEDAQRRGEEGHGRIRLTQPGSLDARIGLTAWCVASAARRLSAFPTSALHLSDET